jgi:hypothetical protein
MERMLTIMFNNINITFEVVRLSHHQAKLSLKRLIGSAIYCSDIDDINPIRRAW